ncbi:hypothetical protein E1301_Tti019117 [Triplophysa tibetana]|uniref:Immunoglobulin domain-containing protein n=1 Tax=Triplophysa tibetana TaxID=1572043 RepID=A0A5A9NP88_9TELE|nr:hypothetical protein E1301_Tti019117 [Triplophysa tibetana]
MKNLSLLLCSLLLNGVFGDTEVKVSVKEGDPVTLNIKPEDIKEAEDLVWRFNGTYIAKINLQETGSQPVYSNGRFGDRLNLERQTGSLTITNIRSQHSGEYKLEIKRTQSTYKTFIVSVSVKSESVSVDVGSDFRLCHDITDIQRDDVIEWAIEGTPIAHSQREPNIVSNRFSGRLSLKMSGCLIINNFRSKDSGLYDVNITGSKHIIHKNFNVTGVFGDEVKVSVKEGDSVTLKIKPEDINGAVELAWRFKDTIIAEIDLQSKYKPAPQYPDKQIFRHRLNLERQTGFLTITNITSQHSGEYHLEIISSSDIKHKTFIVSVSERPLSAGQVIGIICAILVVFAVVGVIAYRRNKYKQQKQKVTVMTVPEGQSVTLESKPQSGVIEWSFRDKVIASFNKNNSDKERLIDRRQVDDQTGSLIIINIRTEDAGLYKVKISSSSRLKSFLQFITGGGPSYRQFNVIVTERIKTVMMGGFVTLETGFTEIRKYDKIQWTFENEKTIIAEMTVGTKPSYDSTDERFTDRLIMDSGTGDLTILAITTELSGVYKAQIISSRGSKERDYRVAISVIAYEGESVTLNTESKIQRDSEIKWISQDETILVTGKNGDDNETKDTDERFRDRVKMNHQTGDLTITKLRKTDAGLYTFQQINSHRKISCRIFSVCVRERVKSVELTGSVTLETGVTEIQRGDVIQWRFRGEETPIAEMTGDTEPSYVSTDERFRNRLKMNTETGDLTITDFTVKFFGVYKALISSSRETEYRTYWVIMSGE